MADNIPAHQLIKLQDAPLTPIAIAAPLLGWLIPGAGHFLLKKYGRGALMMASVFAMFFIGLWMDGKIYTPNTGDILDILGFVGDFGAGGLYLLGRTMDWGHGAVYMATADYGTKFVIISGLLNIISAIDAHHIAIGKKP